MSMDKWIYHFNNDHAEGNSAMTDILGSKGAGLAAMCKLGLPVPPGFTISSRLCSYYYSNHYTLPLGFRTELKKAIIDLENYTGKIFGDKNSPLILSVRSGSKISMPGMMDTILNLGINEEIALSLARLTDNGRFAFDSYRRFLEMYGSTVLDIPKYLFDDAFELQKLQANIINEDGKVTEEVLKKTIKDFLQLIDEHHCNFSADPYEHLTSAIEAVLKSWISERAITYRKLNAIDDSFGTAVNIQSMVFGNMGKTSATGVVFTRCPSTGEHKIFGEFMLNAQGEDIVSGVRTPSPIIPGIHPKGDSMQEVMPEVFDNLQAICKKLEGHYKDMQDIEFTVEQGKLYILQTRSGKRTAAAAVKIAVDMHHAGILSKQEALLRIEPESINQLLHTQIDYTKELRPIAQGLPASPGAATGIVVFSPYEAEELSRHHKVILVRNDTAPEDIKGLHVASGILTARGGMTSHAAVVARGMGKPCVCGASDMVIDENKKIFKVNGLVVEQGEEISIDGANGKVFLGKVPLIQPVFSKEFETILNWANRESKMKVRANAETILDASAAIKFGAFGIGLCRTEHMFFDTEKILLVQQMILAPESERKKEYIDKLLPLQIKDFKELFLVLQGRPVNVRLLDPPLHEFLPNKDTDKKNLAVSLNMSAYELNQRLYALHEVNPMLGHRGCRLGISCPEIYQMQVRAIFTAVKLLRDEGIEVKLELMIPLISGINELKKLKAYIYETVNDIQPDAKFTLGSMIELPRAAIISEGIASEVDYFSFGTNDLTQTTYGISRDDISTFLPTYLEQKIFEHDPFVVIDEDGVGELMAISIKKGKTSNPHLKVGVCGEHAGNPQSIEFFHKLGIDYISCSPYRIPIARLAAAQANIKNPR